MPVRNQTHNSHATVGWFTVSVITILQYNVVTLPSFQMSEFGACDVPDSHVITCDLVHVM